MSEFPVYDRIRLRAGLVGMVLHPFIAAGGLLLSGFVISIYTMVVYGSGDIDLVALIILIAIITAGVVAAVVTVVFFRRIEPLHPRKAAFSALLTALVADIFAMMPIGFTAYLAHGGFNSLPVALGLAIVLFVGIGWFAWRRAVFVAWRREV